VTNSKTKYFVGACILGGGLLIKLGAPLMTIGPGILLAWLATSFLDKRANRVSR
jgi:hypothetical protein